MSLARTERELHTQAEESQAAMAEVRAELKRSKDEKVLKEKMIGYQFSTYL